MFNKTAFIAWNATTRSKILARHINAKIIQCKISTNRIMRLFNYPFLIFITFLDLVSKKFDVVFVQLPPIQAAIPAYLYCKIFRKKLIFDTHSGIFYYQGLHQNIYFKLYCSMIKKIKLNIVHNEDILNRNCLTNTPSVILEEKIYFTPAEFRKKTDLKTAVVCGYGKDEPTGQIIETAQMLPKVLFFLTGNSTKLRLEQKPQNINLTGFLPDIEYEKLLRSVDIILVLTTRSDTILSGAYEAVGLTKPLITSDTTTLKKYFNKGTIHTVNNPPAIAHAIRTAQENLERLYNEMVELRQGKIETWQNQFESIENVLNTK